MAETYSVSEFLVIIPHSNIEKTVAAMQERIFRRFGLTSAIALPPIIPLRFGPPPGRIHAPRGMTVRSTDYETVGFSLYLGVTMHVGGKKLATADILSSGTNRGKAALGSEVPGSAAPFPAHIGFYLCTSGDASLLPAIVGELSPPRLDFHPLGIGRLLMRYTAARPWWQHLSWEIDSLEKIRKQRPGDRSPKANRL